MESHFSVQSNAKLHTLWFFCPFRLLIFQSGVIISAIAHRFRHVGVGIHGLEVWGEGYWLEYLVQYTLSISPGMFAERTLVSCCKGAIKCATRIFAHVDGVRLEFREFLHKSLSVLNRDRSGLRRLPSSVDGMASAAAAVVLY